MTVVDTRIEPGERRTRLAVTIDLEPGSGKFAEQLAASIRDLVADELEKQTAAQPHPFQSPSIMGPCDVPHCHKSEDQKPHIQ